MPARLDRGHHALLFLTAKGADEPVEGREVVLQEGFEVSRLRLEIDAVATEYKQYTAVICRNYAVVAIVQKAL